jgi:nitrate/nitrite transporter NarK
MQQSLNDQDGANPNSPCDAEVCNDEVQNEHTNNTEYTYPEGGLASWLTVFGAWCAMTGGLGLLNTVASLQTYLASNQLKEYSESTVSWIFSVQVFLAFFLGIQIGPAFDVFGPRFLVLGGTILLVVAIMLLGECTKYWHFILDYSVLSGLGISLLLTPALASIGHFFNRRRGFATGIAMTGPSVGGVIFPLVFRAAYPRYGFAWACRIIAFIILFLLAIANIFLRSRLPRSKPKFRDILPDFKIFLDGDGSLSICTAGLFCMEFGLFIPIAYITSFCVANGLDPSFSYQILAILNAASFVGRAVPGLISDKLGRYNTNATMLASCAVVNLAVWLPMSLIEMSQSTLKALTIFYVILFGITSGSNLSLIGPCIGQLCVSVSWNVELP